jgi:hypothetical protein
MFEPKRPGASSIQGVLLTEIDSPAIAAQLFRRKFRGAEPPNRGRHFACFAAIDAGSVGVLTYIHFQPVGDTCLGGGACTDDALLRSVPAATRSALRSAGGPYFALLSYALDRMSSDFLAFFGHTSDERATQIDVRAGFRQTSVPHLLIRPAVPLDETLERALIAKVATFGEF